MATTEDNDIPETGAVFTFGKSKFADNLPSKFWVKNDKVLQIACGDEHTALVAESGRVFMFGPNEWGQLGLGEENKEVNKPSCIKSLKNEKAKYVACGRSHTLVSTESGRIYSFGSHCDGQLGYTASTDQHNPKHIESLPNTAYKMLAAGSDSSVALTEDGRVFTWGNNEDGKLGLGEVEVVSEPTQLTMDRPVVCVACGYYHTALVTDDGRLFTMGESDGGKLGLLDVEVTNIPQHVMTITDPVRWVSCGSSHTVALTENGDCYIFGEGESGQLGLGTDILSVTQPTHLKLPFKVNKAYCGQAFTALISEKGQLYTFGDGRHGKLAHGNDQFSNQFKPYHCKRFANFIVNKVACGGCHMIVTAKPNFTKDSQLITNGEADEMKSLETLTDTLSRDGGSPTLSRSLSAREKRRNEVTRSFSLLMESLPALNRTNLSTTMPATKTAQHKINGNVLSKTVAHMLSVPNDIKSEKDIHPDGEHNMIEKKVKHYTPVPSPRRKLESPQSSDVMEDGSDGDDELNDSSEDGKDDEANKERLAVSAEMQKTLADSSDDNDEEKKADKSAPLSLTNGLEHSNIESFKNVDEVKEIEHDGLIEEQKIADNQHDLKKDQHDNATTIKSPLPIPRKKTEQEIKTVQIDNDNNSEEEEEEEDEKENDKKDKAKEEKKESQDKKKEKGEKESETEKEEKRKKKGKNKESKKEKDVENGKEDKEDEKGKKKDKKKTKEKPDKDSKKGNKKEEATVKEEKEQPDKNKNKKKVKDEKDNKNEKDEQVNEFIVKNEKTNPKDENENKKPPAKKSRLCVIL